MTKREKVMIGVAALLAVMTLPYVWLFRGMTEEHSTLLERYDEQALTMSRINLLEASREKNRQELLSLQEQMKTERDKFSVVTTTYDAHTIFTVLAENNGLSVRNLQISGVQYMDVTPPEQKNQTKEEQNSTSEPSSGKKSLPGLPEFDYTAPDYEPLYPCKLQVDMTVSGKLEDTLRLVDDIEAQGSNYRVESVGYTTFTADDAGNITQTLTVTIYMVAGVPEGGFAQ